MNLRALSEKCGRPLRRLYFLQEDDWDDLVQEVWLRLYELKGENPGVSEYELWQHGTWRAMSFLRSLWTIRKREGCLDNCTILDEDFESRLILNESCQQFLSSLSAVKRRFIELQMEHYAKEEIEKFLGISKRTSRRWQLDIRKCFSEFSLS